jgi:hypothetical protein
LPVQLSPLVNVGGSNKDGCQLRLVQQGLAFFESRPNGGRAGRHEPLHQDHQEADVPLL